MQRIDIASLSDPTVLGRLLSLLEREPEKAPAILETLPPPSAHAQRIGLTGSPGVGKSTLAARLIDGLLEQGERVAVLAVDPTSPLTGGAVLGDRVRMQGNENPGLFIRSLASRGALGGLSLATLHSARVLAALGYTRIIIETVGVGQTGSDIAALADCVVVLLSPESGDGLQMIKAGISELGDIYVVNKADRPGAEAMLAELRFTLSLSSADDNGSTDPAWERPVLALVALEGHGVPELLAALDRHRAWLESLTATSSRRTLQLERELSFRLQAAVNNVLRAELSPAIRQLAARIAQGQLSPDQACIELQAKLGSALQD